MINRIAFLGALLLIFALTINLVTDERRADSPQIPNNEPDLYMLNATIRQFDDDGQLQHRIQADRFTHFPMTDLTTMKKPAMSLGRDRTWEIHAEEGRILNATAYREEIIELWSEVFANQADKDGRFIRFRTENLTVYPEREYAETDERVYIDTRSGRTTAAGMKAYLDTGRFVFFSTGQDRVTSIFVPELLPPSTTK